MAGKDAVSAVVADRAAMLTAVQVANVVGSKLDIPILNNMLVESGPDSLTLTATNLDIEVRIAIPARGEGAALATTVEAKKLAAMVGTSADGCQIGLTLGKEAKRLAVTMGSGRYQLPMLPATDFPRIAFAEGGPALTMRAGDLAAAFGRTAFAESKEEARFFLAGTCLGPVDGKLFAVATNGHVMSEVQIGDAPGGWANAIFPSRLTALLTRLLKDSDEELTVARDEEGERVRLTWGNEAAGAWIVTAKLVQGNFPEWRRAMPPPRPAREVVIDSGALRQAIRRATQVQAAKSELVVLDFAKGRVTVRCESVEHGLAEEDVPASGEVDDFRIGFNAGYLRDLSEAASADTIVIELPETVTRGGSGIDNGTRIVPAAKTGFNSNLMPMAI